jgi:hypothetical protein
VKVALVQVWLAELYYGKTVVLFFVKAFIDATINLNYG